MARTKAAPKPVAAVDPLGAGADDDPMAGFGGGEPNDPFTTIGEEPTEDPLGDFGGPEVATTNGVATPVSNAAKIRSTIASLPAPTIDPVVSSTLADIGARQVAIEAGLNQVAAAIVPVQAAVVSIQTFVGDALSKQLAGFAAQIDAGFAAVLGAIADLKESRPAAATNGAHKPVAAVAAAEADPREAKLVEAMRAALKAKADAGKPVRVASSEASLWLAMASVCKNAGLTTTPEEAHRVYHAAGFASGSDPVRW